MGKAVPSRIARAARSRIRTCSHTTGSQQHPINRYNTIDHRNHGRVLPDFAIADDLAARRLIQVLPQWRLPSGGIHAVFPAARFRPAKVRAFVDLLADREQQRQAANRTDP